MPSAEYNSQGIHTLVLLLCAADASERDAWHIETACIFAHNWPARPCIMSSLGKGADQTRNQISRCFCARRACKDRGKAQGGTYPDATCNDDSNTAVAMHQGVVAPIGPINLYAGCALVHNALDDSLPRAANDLLLGWTLKTICSLGMALIAVVRVTGIKIEQSTKLINTYSSAD